MPTSTFYNLPQEKKDRLLEAARKELARVPYSEASINQIIQEVGISRGSFYTYFADKADLVFCVLEDFLSTLFPEVMRILKENHGDVFELFIYVYDYIHEYSQKHGLDEMFINVLLGLNSDERSSLNMLAERYVEEHQLEQKVLHLVNFSNLRIHSREDMEDLMIILFSITKTSCLELLNNDRQLKDRQRFLRRLEILKHGVVIQ